MSLHVLSISKVIFDSNWNELGISELGAREQHIANSMLVLKADSQKSTLKILIVGMNNPQKLIFGMNTKIRIGSGMLMYNSVDLTSFETLPLDSLDGEF